MTLLFLSYFLQYCFTQLHSSSLAHLSSSFYFSTTEHRMCLERSTITLTPRVLPQTDLFMSLLRFDRHKQEKMRGRANKGAMKARPPRRRGLKFWLVARREGKEGQCHGVVCLHSEILRRRTASRVLTRKKRRERKEFDWRIGIKTRACCKPKNYVETFVVRHPKFWDS